MSKLIFFHLNASRLSLSNLAGLTSESLFVIEPQAQLLGDAGSRLVVKLRADFNAMKDNMDKPLSSLLTPPIRQANAVSDVTIKDIKRSVSAGTKSTIADRSSAGRTLEHFLKPFWDLDKKPLMTQIGMTAEMLARYDDDKSLSAAAQMLSIASLFTSLSDSNATLSTLYNQRLNEYAAATPAASKFKEDVAVDYNAVCDMILRIVNAEPVLPAVLTLYQEIDNIRKKYSALSPAKINLAHAVTEPVSTHIYTGEPVTPIPVVYYEGKKLVFTEDFSVTYRNNVEVGEASVIMHGKGRFTGQHVRKFNIRREL
ncbi:MAG: DUF6261 family protein [Tannerella sp.]|jgi:hypothetical protein|nr:DUF6261 family protein [Tannerella sp.]